MILIEICIHAARVKEVWLLCSFISIKDGRTIQNRGSHSSLNGSLAYLRNKVFADFRHFIVEAEFNLDTAVLPFDVHDIMKKW